jgi:60 kDa SS-A/Ro ribonucleoprotein
MPNKKLFKSASSKPATVPVANTRNEAGGKAYSLSANEALAQIAVTGCMNQTFYASAQNQLDAVRNIASECSDDVIADVAIYARKRGHMKDTPALLLAILAGRKTDSARAQLQRAAPVVLDNGRMLRNFAQFIRSGQFGRKSFGTSIKRIVRNYLNTAAPEKLVRDAIGNDPSLADVIAMVHPKPVDKQREALFGYLVDPKKLDDKKAKFLPSFVKELEAYKRGDGPMPEKAPFMLLTAFAKSQDDWLRLYQRASWTETRINLNTFTRHGVFGPEQKDIIRLAADRIRNPAAIKKARCLPYQLLTAYQNTTEIPTELRNALQDALEVATENVPHLGDDVVVAVDTSGSMSSAITGARGSVTSKTRCIDVAALVASCILRKSPNARIIPFDTTIHRADLNPRDSVMTNAQKLSRYGGGGTDCSSVMRHLNQTGAKSNLVIYVSDNESWADRGYSWSGGGTGLMTEWVAFKKRNPQAKLVLIDLTPNTHSQAAADKDILRVGGFSDAVFDAIANFGMGQGNFLDQIRKQAASAADPIGSEDLTETEA